MFYNGNKQSAFVYLKKDSLNKSYNCRSITLTLGICTLLETLLKYPAYKPTPVYA